MCLKLRITIIRLIEKRWGTPSYSNINNLYSVLCDIIYKYIYIIIIINLAPTIMGRVVYILNLTVVVIKVCLDDSGPMAEI